MGCDNEMIKSWVTITELALTAANAFRHLHNWQKTGKGHTEVSNKLYGPN